jgi:hypothetical protein
MKGRPKGSKNKHTFNAEELAQKFQCEPLEILLLFAMGDWKALGYDSSVEVAESDKGATFIKHTISPELRASCAEKACKYLYSQRQAVQMSGEMGIKLTVEDYCKQDE